MRLGCLSHQLCENHRDSTEDQHCDIILGDFYNLQYIYFYSKLSYFSLYKDIVVNKKQEVFTGLPRSSGFA